jgi:hypothetical protein
VATFGHGVDGTFDRARERGRDVGANVAKTCTSALLVRRANIAQVAPLNGIGPREDMEQEHAQAVDVAPGRRRLPGQHLGRDIQRCACQIRRRAVVALTARSEIHQHHAAVLGDHHVVGFDIAVDQPRGMNGLDRAAEIDADPRRLHRAE